ncbi:hypothetical protein [Paraburkholderia sp. BL21I4N1]|uniref:hypothetical protein n=1 Tax=Paraburkholderia sp. BL21I4N1 TaxID=1938801 RepID=UPI000CFB569A|nr:hypothetical protein [Paraburkholderia sp. BL21I4N1]PQV53343.1 hypothetical protein B0G83_102429 [Paraburkholderia sp. BL21I4N1]
MYKSEGVTTKVGRRTTQGPTNKDNLVDRRRLVKCLKKERWIPEIFGAVSSWKPVERCPRSSRAKDRRGWVIRPLLRRRFGEFGFGSCRFDLECYEPLTTVDLTVLLLCVVDAQSNSNREAKSTFRGTMSVKKAMSSIGPVPGWLTDDVIRESLDRMGDCVLRFHLDGEKSSLDFVQRDAFVDSEDGYGYVLNRSTVELLSDHVGEIDFVRMVHLNNAVARWIHATYACGFLGNNLPVRVLRSACGYDEQQANAFRQCLDEAITELQTPRTIEKDGKTIVEIPPQVALDLRIQNDALHFEYAVDVEEHDSATPGRVFVITTAAEISDGYIDFAARLAKFGNKVDGVVRMAPARKNQDNSLHLLAAISDLMTTYKPRHKDIVAIVRGGGGDRWQYTMYQDVSSVGGINALRNQGAYVVLGVGHTRHQWLIDPYVDYVAEVPFAAAEHVNGVLAQGIPAVVAPAPVEEVAFA